MRGLILFFTLMVLCFPVHAHKANKKHNHPAKVERKTTNENTSMLVFNIKENKHEFEVKSNVIRPIASVTKLMTAMVTLNYDRNMSKTLHIKSAVSGSLPRTKEYTRYELLNAMLVRSDNSAAETLASDYPGGRETFIKEMNKLAFEYGMISTNFDDPTGLSSSNTASAIDIATMVARASEYNLIREISTKKQIEIETRYKRKIRTIVLNNTNRPVLFEFDNIVVSKTGFTNPAGYCLALAVEKEGRKYSVVILGAKNKFDRIHKVENIMYNHLNDTSGGPKEVDN